MPFVHHAVKQWGCGYTIEDDKGLNEKIQGHPMLKPMFKLMQVGWKLLSRDDHKGLDWMN